ncbi:phage tail protein [Marinobacter oulmenensis]|uniref:Phage-related tail fiber protein n=1 Tax=Marinobacter oulmenensis TaxID=643747 RepID=A0A840UDD6_9GAMM|nr:phage tail protein [Marinobacter oulmenensis]MBB5320465.1 phage-related tail fiber protein [Marinobacter oulmenensis]
MPATYYTVLTEVGQSKLANAVALGQTIDIAELAVGDGSGSLPTPETDRTALINEVRRAAINRSEVDDQNPNWVVVEQVLPPDVGGWTIREVGIYDVDGDLIGYGNYPETYKPVLAEGSSRTQTIRFVMEVSDTAAVTLKVDPSVVLATRDYADTAVENHAAETEGVHGIPAGKAVIHTGSVATTTTAGIVEKATPTEAKQGTADKFPDAKEVLAAIQANPYLAEAPGKPFPVFDHLTGVNPPSNAGTAKFIKLTAGEDGAGGYNEGLLINETVTGSGPTVEITAEIATGPSEGAIVHLINSEKRYIAPGESSGTAANDQMQQITGTAGGPSGAFLYGGMSQTQGAFSTPEIGTHNADVGSSKTRLIEFDSANSPNARTGDHTNVKRIEATHYMRIA